MVVGSGVGVGVGVTTGTEVGEGVGPLNPLSTAPISGPLPE